MKNNHIDNVGVIEYTEVKYKRIREQVSGEGIKTLVLRLLHFFMR